jgi:hypothetical protein
MYGLFARYVRPLAKMMFAARSNHLGGV